MQPVRTLQISRRRRSRRRLRNGRYSGTPQQRQYGLGRLQNLHTAVAISEAVLEAAIQEERRAKLRWFFVRCAVNGRMMESRDDDDECERGARAFSAVDAGGVRVRPASGRSLGRSTMTYGSDGNRCRTR